MLSLKRIDASTSIRKRAYGYTENLRDETRRMRVRDEARGFYRGPTDLFVHTTLHNESSHGSRWWLRRRRQRRNPPARASVSGGEPQTTAAAHRGKTPLDEI
ncbi:hypothetical protein MRX96_015561 [Rhipicephalus microplus]